MKHSPVTSFHQKLNNDATYSSCKQTSSNGESLLVDRGPSDFSASIREDDNKNTKKEVRRRNHRDNQLLKKSINRDSNLLLRKQENSDECDRGRRGG